MKTLAYEKIGNCIVFVGGRHPFDNTEWDTYSRFLETTFEEGAKTDTKFVCLVLTEVGPTGAQRQRLNDALAPVFKTFRTAVLTSSHLARGILTAMSWIYPVYRAFTSTELDAEIEYLNVDTSMRATVKKIVEDLKAELVKP